MGRLSQRRGRLAIALRQEIVQPPRTLSHSLRSCTSSAHAWKRTRELRERGAALHGAASPPVSTATAGTSLQKLAYVTPTFLRHTRESGYRGPKALRGTLDSRFRGSDDTGEMQAPTFADLRNEVLVSLDGPGYEDRGHCAGDLAREGGNETDADIIAVAGS